jgi:hypothetical protein
MDPMTVDTFAADLPIAARMRHLLKNGPLTYAEIAEQLGEKRDSVIKAADRGKAFTKVTNMPDGIHRIALVERWTA